MKKAIKINLCGIIFHIDEDAYSKLKKYLDAISSHFLNQDESKEIINDIEARIAELFEEKKPKDEEVISLELVNEVIEIMGNPEDIADIADSSDDSSGQRQSGGYHSKNKRLYRDADNSVISGVCGGLGAYFNIDPIIFRLLFVLVLFAGGASLIVYIILWIVLPKAETAGQKLEMRGEPVNVSNIEKKVKKEYETAKENVKTAVKSETVKKTKSAANDFFHVLGKILLVFIKVILIIIGTSLVLAGIGLIIALISGTFVGLHFLPFGPYNFSLSEFLTPFSDPVSITLLVISLTLLFLIPIVAMVYGLIKLIFSIKTRNRGLTIGATTLWGVALLMTIGIIAFESNNYSKSGNSVTKSTLTIDSDTIVVAVNNLQKKDLNQYILFDLDLDDEWLITEDLDRIYGKINLDIEKSTNGLSYIEIDKRSKGKSWEDAETNAGNLKYNFKTSANELEIDPYFFIGGEEKWRFPRLELTIYIPEGKHLILEKETREILNNVYNVNHVSEWSMANKTWMMTDDGLELVE
jgi:phage shock protein PspC (stress-responsive transcriptional regulator)